MSVESRPLWSLCTVNDDVLPDSTAKDYSFDYVDISSVTTGLISPGLATLNFGEAPSRARRLARQGDVIVSTVRTYLKAIAPVGATETDRVYSTGFAVLRPDPQRMNAHFFKYALLAEGFIDQITAHSVGVSYPAINASDLMRFAVPTPSLSAQRRIADYLDRETAEIDAMDAELDRLVETLRERLLSHLLSLGHRLSSDDNRTRLGYLLDKQTRPTVPGSGVVTAFRDGQVTLRSNRREEGFTMSASEAGYQGVEPGDFVFHGLDGFAGAVGVSDSRGNASPVYHVCRSTLDTSEEFMAWALRALAVSGFLEAYAWSVRQRSVDYRNWSTFAGLPVAYIEPHEQRRIVAELDEQTARIDDMIADAQRLKALLAERRSTLITDVVTGRKEVPA